VDIPRLRAATPLEQVQIEALGLPIPPGADCLVWPSGNEPALAFVVVAPGTTERRVRAVAAGDPSDPIVTEAVVSAREAVICAINGTPA